jgi:hypothetical protein
MTNIEKVSEKIKAIFPIADKLTIETINELKSLIDIAVTESMPQKEFDEKVIDKLIWKYDKDFMVCFTVKGMKFGLFAKGKDKVHTNNAVSFMSLFARVIQNTTIKPKEPAGLKLIKPN